MSDAKPKKAPAKKKPALPDTPGVDALLSALEHPLKAEVQALRRIFLGADARLRERVKWNSPSFFAGEADLGAFTLRQEGFVHFIMVFPKGMAAYAECPLFEGKHVDRRELKFKDMGDVLAKQPLLEAAVQDWVRVLLGEAA